MCAAHGLPAYEISNHARPGSECRHNLVYWRAREYAGVGPGAHGGLDIHGSRHATATEKRPEAWLQRVQRDGHGLTTDDVLTREEMADEFLLMGLRLAEGIDPARYTVLMNRPLDPVRIAALREHGLVETTEPDGFASACRASPCSMLWLLISRLESPGLGLLTRILNHTSMISQCKSRAIGP